MGLFEDMMDGISPVFETETKYNTQYVSNKELNSYEYGCPENSKLKKITSDDFAVDTIKEDVDDIDGDEVFTEAVYPDTIPYLKCLTRIVTLPKGEPNGYGNLCFLYAESLDESIALMNNKTNFLKGNRYFWYFYNQKYTGILRHKRYRINMTHDRPAIYKKVETSVKGIKGFKKLDLTTSNLRSTYFDLSKYLEIFNSMCMNLQPLRRVNTYWAYMNSIFNLPSLSRFKRKFVLIDISKYRLTKGIKENLRNPLFNLYYTLFKAPDLIKNLNIDFYFYAGRKIMKVNPSLITDPKKDYKILKTEMYKMFRSMVPQIGEILDEEKIERDEAVDAVTTTVVNSVTTPEEEKTDVVTKLKSDIVKTYDGKGFTGTAKEEPVKTKSSKTTSKDAEIDEEKTKKEIETSIKKKAEKITEEIKGTKVDSKVAEGFISSKIESEINEDKELLEKIYRSNQREKIKKSPASSARDQKLREEQLSLKVDNMTIKDIQEFKAKDVPIETKDISNVIKSGNKNVKTVKFDNVNKIYDEKVMKNDIVNTVLSLNNKSIPMTLRSDVKIEDTSDVNNYKDTYTFQLEDVNRQRHTIKVDIPKFLDHKFLYVNGSEKIIKNQLFLYPVVKIGEDTVQIVTNYNKMTLERVDSKATSSVERFSKLLSSNDEMKKYCTGGNVFMLNNKVITTLEYDSLAKIIMKYKSGKCELFFSQADAVKHAETKGVRIPSNRLYIGTDKEGKPVFINTDTQRSVDGMTIVDIIIDSLPTELQTAYSKIKPPKRLAYVKVKIMKQYISIAYLLGYWEGLTSLLNKLNVKYSLEKKLPPVLDTNESYIKFADCYLVYHEDTTSALILDGFKVMDTSSYEIAEMDDYIPYLDYFKKRYGKTAILNTITNFYEFTIDPITEEILQDINLPTKIVELVIYAISLLADSQYTPEINQNLYRVRSHEIVAGILYGEIARAYLDYKNSGGRKKLSINRDAVIKELMAVKTVEESSTLNPTLELDNAHSVSTKGFRGINLDESYTIQKRTFDPTGIGLLGPSSSPDGNVGVAKTLTLEPPITSVRGYIDVKYDEKNPEKSLKDLKDTNVFSAAELLIPLGATYDDPTRLGHAIKQSKHVIPVKDSSPVLMSNGMEEACRFHLSSHFVINAEEDGEVVEFNEKEKLMVVRYKSGKCRAVDLNGEIVKNGGGGFYLSNVLLTDLTLGSKFKKNDVLAYHKDFFTNDPYNNCRMNMGTLAKVAIMSTYNTYEDSTFITNSLSERAATELVFCKQIVIGKNSNVDFLIKVGDEIEVGEPLAIFDTSYEDADLNTFLAVLSDEQKNAVIENSRNTVPSKYSGTIEDIKIYSAVELDEMSSSLRTIVKKYYDKINKRKKVLEMYDPESKDSIVKCGVLVNQTASKVEPNRYGIIKGQNVEDSVLIEVYIKHSEPLEVGSKIANFTGLKNTIGEIIPKGYEPWSEFRKDEEISTIIAANSILKRMTPSIFLTALGNKTVIELKRKLKEIYES